MPRRGFASKGVCRVEGVSCAPPIAYTAASPKNRAAAEQKSPASFSSRHRVGTSSLSSPKRPGFGCVATEHAPRSVLRTSSSVVTASRRSSSVAAGSMWSASAPQNLPHLERASWSFAVPSSPRALFRSVIHRFCAAPQSDNCPRAHFLTVLVAAAPLRGSISYACPSPDSRARPEVWPPAACLRPVYAAVPVPPQRIRARKATALRDEHSAPVHFLRCPRRQ